MHFYNNVGLTMYELEIGKFAISFSYRDNARRIHKGFWRRFGFYWNNTNMFLRWM